MKKIIHVLTDTNVGGAGVWLMNFARAYDSVKYDCTAFLPEKSELSPKLITLGMRVVEVPQIADESFSKGGIKELRDRFKREKPDIVHTHASLSARIAAKECGISVVSTRHCLEDPKTGVKRLIYGAVNNTLSNIVIGVSNAVCENLRKDGISKRKLRLVYNGVYPLRKYTAEDKIRVRQKYGIPENAVTVGIVARLEPVKNHRLFLDSASLICGARDDVRFVIVGGGSLESELREYCRELAIEDKVVFTGYKPDITAEMNMLDINTITSEREALSISLIEGMSIGVPAIATASGGPSEVIDNKKSGFIVPNYNKEAFAEAVLELADSKELRRKMGIEGMKRSREIFSVEAMSTKLEEIYDNLK